MAKLMRWQDEPGSQFKVLYIFENNKWVRYTSSHFYVPDTFLGWGVPTSKGFATAQMLLKNGYTYAPSVNTNYASDDPQDYFPTTQG